MIVRQLSNHDWMVFDRTAKALYLIPEAEAGKNKPDLTTAQKLAQTGHARKFEKHDLEAIQSALSIVVLLG